MQKLFVAFRFLVYVGVWLVVWYFALTFVLGLVMPVVQGRGRTTTVPNLVGMPAEKALAVAKEKGLKARVDTTVPTLDAPAGTVVGQEPSSGTVVKRGRTVYLTISAGAESRTVPDIVGMSLDEAVKSLKDFGFTVEISPIYTLDEEPGYVLRMYPPPGSSLPIGSTVTLYYSEEPPDTLSEEGKQESETEVK